MIKISPEIDLGKDKERMTDPNDAKRQTVTVETLLSRFFDPDDKQRREVQIVADEVGMGKTFVALATAFSILKGMRSDGKEADLSGACGSVLILVPGDSLYKKWRKEVGEFVNRCIAPEKSDDAEKWFRLAEEEIADLDTLIRFSQRRLNSPRILVAKESVFSRQSGYAKRQCFMLAALFRYWSNGFTNDRRKKLLKDNMMGWTEDHTQLTNLPDESDWAIDQDDIYHALYMPDYANDIEYIRQKCLDITNPYARGRDEILKELVAPELNKLYRKLIPVLLKRDFPLVIVDEAHNWKNHPKVYKHFIDIVAPHTRRLLMLTATPFQLKPDEMLKILEAGEHINPRPQKDGSQKRRMFLKDYRERTIATVVKASQDASRLFQEAWRSLPAELSQDDIINDWKKLAGNREHLLELASQHGALRQEEIDRYANDAVSDIDPSRRKFYREALRLYAFNADYSDELGKMVIRHRRKQGHRQYLVGREFVSPPVPKPGCEAFHRSAGIDVRGDGELPHYLLMRCVTEMKQLEGKKGRSSLAGDMTGCYSTLFKSAEGNRLKKAFEVTTGQQMRFKLLKKLVSDTDHSHPKVVAVVDMVEKLWEKGEKTLIFCFRENNADRLNEIINERIEKRIEARKQKLKLGKDGMRTIRSRLTSKERDLSGLILDRVLWSYFWARREKNYGANSIMPDELSLTDVDIAEIAKAGIIYGVDMADERPDRVFLTRVTEHVIAQRLLRKGVEDSGWSKLLTRIANHKWVETVYGIDGDEATGGVGKAQGKAQSEDGQLEGHDEKGWRSRYERRNVTPDPSKVKDLTTRLVTRREAARKKRETPILDQYAESPNFFLGVNTPMLAGQTDSSEHIREVIIQLHSYIHSMIEDIGSGKHDDAKWIARRELFHGLRRAISWDSVLLRLIPEKTHQREEGWGHVLVERFYQPLENQTESLADRFTVFLEDLKGAAGTFDDPSSSRAEMLDVTKLRSPLVDLVKGSTKERQRKFTGFNSPLFPEILVCTSVGQEGIDLHRYCRHVVHFDLAWNPATIEQRTGRIDRIGSKTSRERAHVKGGKPRLEIGLPYLAGTYDERMFEQLLLRAQIFEVLTGGDLATIVPENEEEDASEGEKDISGIRSLPSEIVNDLRVKLNVWPQTN
ncbi:MAG: DEAD/DEAH box helicase family protein [Nitrospinae bacterium]|nr:DEAD/DEAH box helicase family protein [Nitrospinota bacterium]